MRLEITHDEDTTNPRHDFDHPGTTFIMHHRRLAFGDAHTEAWQKDPQETYDWIQRAKKSRRYVILPVYMYDHSGRTIRTTPFDCPWDSGLIGWIYADRHHPDIKGRRTKTLEDRLRSEIEVLNTWLTGDIWSVSILDDEGNFVDGCSGFYGLKYAEEEGARMLKERFDSAQRQHEARFSRAGKDAMSSEKPIGGAGESSPSMQLLAGSVPILDEALNYFYPERACDPPMALAARMALFTLRDRIRDYVKANKEVSRER